MFSTDATDAVLSPEGVARLEATINDTVATLRSAVGVIKSRVAREENLEILAALFGPLGLAVWAFTSTAEAKAAVLSGLKTIENIIDRLGGPSKGDVLRGEENPDKWLAAAQTVADGIEAQAQILNESSTYNLVADQMQVAAAELAEVAKMVGQKALTTVKFGLPIVLIGALGLGIFLLPRLLAPPMPFREWEPEDSLE